MTGPAPEYMDKKYYSKWSDNPYKTAMKSSAPDEFKMLFEEEQNMVHDLKSSLETFGISTDCDDPYYVWDGSIVERKSLEGRELPIFENNIKVSDKT